MNNYTYKQFTDAKKMCDELEVFQKGGKWYTKLVTLNSEERRKNEYKKRTH